MSGYPDPFDSRSPWDEPEEATPKTATEAPVSTAVAPTPENVTLSFKGGAGYDASLLVLRAGSIAEMDALLESEAATLKTLLERASKIQSFNTGLNGSGSAPKTFNRDSGKVESSGNHKGVTTCEHGDRTYRTGQGQNGKWEAMFCPAREKSEQCDAAWKNNKTGAFEIR